jgi:hypothetical protein
MTVAESNLASLSDSRRHAYDQLIAGMTSDLSSPKYKEELSAYWSKSYQTDFAKVKSTKEGDVSLIFGSIEDPEIPSLLTNSLARTGLGEKINHKMEACNSVDSYSILDMYLSQIRMGHARECIAWCLSRAEDMKASENERLLATLINVELQFIQQSCYKPTELASTLRNIRSCIADILQVYRDFDVSALEMKFTLHKVSSETLEATKQYAIDIFSSLFMSCMNLPRFDVLKIR